ncbi:hypothetical protein KY290_006552 [Solanum tuberosum]|uniref:Uncharacterized protein n=1 Tax=Solanum tuberosum TaxID=4113 RepID=A0ABQ7WHS3_SOLTU|nr:hypothetical protein KY289_005508 [Solanum tuberosum]KAH0751854.1 hypothetical protein KY285_005002 [Solanum tuberosum]KAH0780125.1 hypothetical protein KY290_006552 [Solanum tuberosum]
MILEAFLHKWAAPGKNVAGVRVWIRILLTGLLRSQWRRRRNKQGSNVRNWAGNWELGSAELENKRGMGFGLDDC